MQIPIYAQAVIIDCVFSTLLVTSRWGSSVTVMRLSGPFS
jgi:hypothetical protein